MTKTRLVIFVLLSISTLAAFCWGFALERAAHGIIVDFKVVYVGTRCLIRGCDPYDESQLMKVYLSEGGKPPSSAADANRVRQVVALQVYFPTAFLFVAPFALLPWTVAHALWSGLTAVTMTVAAFLIWTLAQDNAPGASFYLISFLLVNSGVLFAGGNPAGIAVSLCLVAVWCFLRNRYVFFGALCLAVSLALKPHDSGLVWLYFLLARDGYRKNSLRTILLTSILGLIALLWISHISPHWLLGLRSNLSATSMKGGITDPGPNSLSGPGGAMMINLQTVVSVFRDDPDFYNPIAYSVCGLLVIVWIILTLRSRRSLSSAYVALAAIAPLSMLPVYHRPHDAKLLLLTIPACAMLMARRGALAWIALVLNSAAIILTCDLPLGALAIATKGLYRATGSFQDRLMAVFVCRPVPLILLALGIFYLWIYGREAGGNLPGEASMEPMRAHRTTS